MEQFRRHPYSCPRGHPEGVRRLDVFFDYGAFPVWGKGVRPATDGRPATVMYGMLTPKLLGISARLTQDLRAWAQWADRHSEVGGGRSADGEAHLAHVERGRELADRLAEETGAEVVYDKVSERGNPPDCPHCGTARRRRIERGAP